MKKITIAGILLLSFCFSKAKAQVNLRVVRPVVYRAPYRAVAVVKPAPVVMARPIVVAAPPVIVRPVPARIAVVRPAPVTVAVPLVRIARIAIYR